MRKLKLQGLSFSFQSPSHLYLDFNHNIQILFTGTRWELWGRNLKTGENMLCHASKSRDTLIGIVAWAKGTRKDLPEGYIDGSKLKRI